MKWTRWWWWQRKTNWSNREYQEACFWSSPLIQRPFEIYLAKTVDRGRSVLAAPKVNRWVKDVSLLRKRRSWIPISEFSSQGFYSNSCLSAFTLRSLTWRGSPDLYKYILSRSSSKHKKLILIISSLLQLLLVNNSKYAYLWTAITGDYVLHNTYLINLLNTNKREIWGDHNSFRAQLKWSIVAWC
jgi:hypothetical protein